MPRRAPGGWARLKGEIVKASLQAEIKALRHQLLPARTQLHDARLAHQARLKTVGPAALREATHAARQAFQAYRIARKAGDAAATHQARQRLGEARHTLRGLRASLAETRLAMRPLRKTVESMRARLRHLEEELRLIASGETFFEVLPGREFFTDRRAAEKFHNSADHPEDLFVVARQGENYLDF
jgi:chromosome segregation ATPase